MGQIAVAESLTELGVLRPVTSLTTGTCVIIATYEA